MNISITSKQEKQYKKFVEDSAEKALEKVGLDKNALQRLFENGGKFQADIVVSIRKHSLIGINERQKKAMDAFMIDTFTWWYNKDDAKNAKQSVEMVFPEELDWDVKKADIDPSKFGEYTVNPDTVGIDWEKIPAEKIKIFDFAEFVGKPRAELAKHLVENYSDKYHIPGIEYWKYLIENQDKVPKNLKDGNYYYFFGSILRGKDGRWLVPHSAWHGGKWRRHAGWLRNGWDSYDRVLLLEK